MIDREIYRTVKKTEDEILKIILNQPTCTSRQRSFPGANIAAGHLCACTYIITGRTVEETCIARIRRKRAPINGQRIRNRNRGARNSDN